MRNHLRHHTADLHDSLDRRVQAFDIAHGDNYARFLAFQLAAREPIERWSAHNCAPDLRPPVTSTLLREDLEELGRPAPECGADWSPPADADAIGMAWAIAGSHLGNRAMLAGLRKRGRDDLPARFLGDPAMVDFWKTLRPGLERPVSEPRAVAALRGARAVFARFAESAGLLDARQAA